MKKYEIFRFLTMPLMPTNLWLSWLSLRKLVKMTFKQKKYKPLVLDVGGRKSPYTIGLDARIHISEIERSSEIQKKLNLGINSKINDFLKNNRSNVEKIIIDDMTNTQLPNDSYDIVVSIEVIEHVKDDEEFVKNIAKVLKKDGSFYLTTPNGDYIKNEPPHYNPDHIKHYTKTELYSILKKYFQEVTVYYSVKTGKFRFWGLSGYTFKKPVRTIKGIIGNIINKFESIGRKNISNRSAHLVAICRLPIKNY